MPEVKICGKCKRSRFIEHFRPRQDEWPGRRSTCIDCERIVYRARYAAGVYKKGVSKRKTPFAAFKIAAKNAAREAMRHGVLFRKPCDDCGNVKSEAHHPDYSKPLEVDWLCRRCHMKRHRLPTFTPLQEKDVIDALIEKKRGEG